LRREKPPNITVGNAIQKKMTNGRIAFTVDSSVREWVDKATVASRLYHHPSILTGNLSSS
jgi:hypothetical protein